MVSILIKQKEEHAPVRLRGDRLRDLILLVSLISKYGGGKVKIAWLRRALDYSEGAIIYGIEHSGFFERRGDAIRLTDKGEEYVRRRLMPYYSAFHPLSYLLVLLGCLLLAQWYLRIYANIIMVFDWYSGLALIVGGLVLRFSLPRIHLWMIKLLAKDSVRPRRRLADTSRLQKE